MEALKFKNFVWPVNPEVYRQHYEREPVYTKDASGNVAFSGMGPLKRTITGSGCFFGTEAHTQFLNLAGMCSDTQPASLVHPLWGTVSAYLTELEMTQEPRADFVAYSFTFREADADGAIPD